MNTSDNSYYELLNRLRYFADNHYLINSFTHGQEAELDISKRTLFPTMHVVPPVITRSNGNKLFAFEIVFADLPRMKEDKVENQMEVISDCDRIADDLVNEIKNGNTVFGRMVDLVGDAVTEPFTEDYANVLTGVTLRVTLAAPYTFNACDIPANWNSNDPTEPVYGSRELTMNIYDEGNFIVAAREMNFVGSGVTVTHDANRAIVTITGGGGGGGAVDSVTGNIVNNTDPANPVVTQVQPDWNASSGLGQILNKPTIPSAQVNSDWDATSGVAQILNKPTSLPPSGSAGGDLTGSYPNPTVSKIHGIDVQNGTASDGQILKYHAAENKWKHHTQVKADVGLGNVDNTSDANKPVSTAQQAALNAKQDTLVSGTNIKTINGITILGSGNISVNQTFYDTIRFYAALTGGQTLYSAPGLSGSTSTEAAGWNIAAPTVHGYFRVALTSTQHASGTLVIDRIFKNYSGTVLATHTLTIPAGSVAGEYVYTGTSYDNSSGGAQIQFRIKNNATSTSGIVLGIENQYQ